MAATTETSPTTSTSSAATTGAAATTPRTSSASGDALKAKLRATGYEEGAALLRPPVEGGAGSPAVAPAPHPQLEVVGAPTTPDTTVRWAGGLSAINALMADVDSGLDDAGFQERLGVIRKAYGFIDLTGKVREPDDGACIDESDQGAPEASPVELSGSLNPKVKSKPFAAIRFDPLMTRGVRAGMDAGRDRHADRLNGSLDLLEDLPLFVNENDGPPGVAHHQARAGADDVPIEAVRVPRVDPRLDSIPRPNAVFRSDDYEYLVEVVQNRQQWRHDPRQVLVPLFHDLTIIRQIPIGGRSAKGRSYGGLQHAFRSPRATAMVGGTPSEQACIQAIEDEFARDGIPLELSQVAATTAVELVVGGGNSRVIVDAAGLYGICLPTAAHRVDARQSTPATDNLNRITSLAMDGALAGGHHAVHADVRQTHAPRSVRAGNREPQHVAGGVSAATAMGNPGAGQGELGSHEYCHLVGDGDGGACEENNLVVGTNSNNTEQLALETVLRQFRPQLRRLGWSVDLEVTSLVQAPTPVVGGPAAWVGNHVAEHTRYAIHTRPKDAGVNPTGIPSPVHVAMLDAQRGVIPKAEVIIIQEELRAKMRERVAAIEAAHEAHHVGHAHGRRPWPNTPAVYAYV